MARTTGPLLSLDASGKLADAIVFSKWKGRNYVRALVKPSNPQSGGQVGMRSAFKFLSQEWSGLITADKASWETLAEAAAVAPFNSYMSKNLFRNRNFLSPTQVYPAAAADTPSTIDTFTATAGERQITIAINDLGDQDDNWGFFLYRSTSTGFTPAFDNLIAIIVANSTTLVNFVDTPLVPDTYYYDSKPFTLDGVIGTLKGEINATVT